MTQENPAQATPRLWLSAPFGMKEEVRRFFPLLQQGFFVRARVGCSIRELLCNQFAIDPDYLSQRITTIFLNGRPVDSEGSRVEDGATLALSAAMPGLVGATMRRGGYYAALRGAITHIPSAEGAAEKGGVVRLKLFNLLMAELGPGFLHHGILLPPAALADFLAEQPPDFWELWREALLNGRPIPHRELQARRWLSPGEERVELSIIFKE